MSKVVISDVPPFNGEYEIDLGSFNGYELHKIKAISGLRVYEIDDGLQHGDYDLFVAVAAIALKRHGHTYADQAVEALLEATVGTFKLVLGDPETNGKDSPHEEDGDKPDPTDEPDSSGATPS